MTKKILIIIGLAIVAIGAFLFLNRTNQNPSSEQQVLKTTLALSGEYALLRYQSDNVLANAKAYGDYDKWNEELTEIIDDWQEFEIEAQRLEKAANKLAEKEISFKLINQALAYDTKEANQVINGAKPNQRIATLAKYYGVDAKMAQLILNQTQDQASREAYGGEGDVAATYETGAMRIKNGAKVTVFVGTVIATGGTSALAASGALAQTAVVVSGVDLALEVTEDEARIALGDKNKVSEYVSGIRAVTEPAASILTIVNIPGNVSQAAEKLGLVVFTADQIRSTVQDEKILGISVKTTSTGEIKAEISSISKEELPKWRQENNGNPSAETIEEIINNFEETNDEEKDVETPETSETKPSNTKQLQNTAQKIAGTYSGSALLQHVEEDVETPDSLPVTLQLNEAGSGTVNVNGYSGEAYYGGNSVNFTVTMKDDGAVVNCVFSGKASKSGNRTVISGSMDFSMMGVNFASYSWSAQN